MNPQAAVSVASRPSHNNDFDAATADNMDDFELDQLSFGVMCLAPDGLILRYNLAEGRLARLDPATVVGRNFFTDVAPCTNTEDFFGRFRSVTEEGATPASVRFKYIFDFKFGAQEVDVEISRVPGGARTYLFINRRSILPARTGPEARQAAPAQAELAATDDSELGILRNDRSERTIAVPIVIFETLARRVEARSPDLWRELSHDWGLDTGRRLVIELETQGTLDDDRPLHRRPMREVVEQLSVVLREQGWGRTSFDFSFADRGVLKIDVHASALASNRTRTRRACHFLSGMLEAVLNHLAGRRLHVEEAACACSSGLDHCELIVVGEARRERVATLARTASSFASVMDALEAEDAAPTQ